MVLLLAAVDRCDYITAHLQGDIDLNKTMSVRVVTVVVEPSSTPYGHLVFLFQMYRFVGKMCKWNQD